MARMKVRDARKPNKDYADKNKTEMLLVEG
jgi:hypothetical protein